MPTARLPGLTARQAHMEVSFEIRPEVWPAFGQAWRARMADCSGITGRQAGWHGGQADSPPAYPWPRRSGGRARACAGPGALGKLAMLTAGPGGLAYYFKHSQTQAGSRRRAG